MKVRIPTYTTAGTTHESPNYEIRFKDHRATWRKVVGFPVKMAAGQQRSEALGNKLVALASLRVTHEPMPPDMQKWIQEMPADLRRKLATWDVIDGRRMLGSLPLWRHLLAFGRNMRTGGTTRKHRRLTIARCIRMVRGINARYIDDIDLEAAQTFRQAMRDGTTIGTGKRARKVKISRATANHHATALVMFCRWAFESGRAPSNPLTNFKPIKVDGAPAHDRRAATPADMVALIEATCAAPTRFKMTGRQRALLYAFAASTGLRAGECRSLARTIGEPIPADVLEEIESIKQTLAEKERQL